MEGWAVCSAGPVRQSRRPGHLLEQVDPGGIVLFDQREFPLSRPPLDRRLALNGGLDSVVRFAPHQQPHAVEPRELGRDSGPMIGHAPDEVVRDAGVKRSVALARENINSTAIVAHRKGPMPYQAGQISRQSG